MKEFSEVTNSNPCVICGKTSWCRDSDKVTICRRSEVGDVRIDKNGCRYSVVFKADRKGEEYNFKRRNYRPQRRMSNTRPEIVGKVYKSFMNHLVLSDEDLEGLIARGFKPLEIRNIGYKTANPCSIAGAVHAVQRLHGSESVKNVPGFYLSQGVLRFASVKGLLIPVRNIHKDIIALKVRSANSECKYFYVSSSKYGGAGPGSPVHVAYSESSENNKSARVTEGEIKADYCALRTGVTTISVPGVSNWRRCLPTLKALGVKFVKIAFDQDWASNSFVALNLKQLIAALKDLNYGLEIETWK